MNSIKPPLTEEELQYYREISPEDQQLEAIRIETDYNRDDTNLENINNLTQHLQTESQSATDLNFTSAYQISPVAGILTQEFNHAVNMISGIILENKDKFKTEAVAEFKTSKQSSLKNKVVIEVLKMYKGIGVTPTTHPKEIDFARRIRYEIADVKNADGTITP